MILVDTSVWVDHFRRGDVELRAVLEAGEVLIHPFVLGEIACGNLRGRGEVLGLLGRLPRAPSATDAEALLFLERHSLMGKGIGYLDVHLLASAALAAACIWTRDRRLRAAADRLDLGVRAD